MQSNKRAKMITLVITVVVLIGIATGIYFVTRQPEEAPGPSLSQPEVSPVVPDEPEQSAPQEQGAIVDSLVLLEGGTFTMGSPDSERQRQEDEVSHEVTISPFYADPYEVTQQDYEALMGENPSHFVGDTLPVEGVTWYDAVEYCNALSESRGLTPVYAIDSTAVTWDRSADGYRLLTEAEWEYAARAGTTTVFHDGDQITSDNANFEGSYPYLIEENYVSRQDPNVVTSANRGETIPVDSLSPNGFGLYNMHGNVSEWCFDYYGEYDITQTADPAGPSSGTLRINRGGGWNDFAKQLRSAYRSATTPDTVEQNMGFRIARNASRARALWRRSTLWTSRYRRNPAFWWLISPTQGIRKTGPRSLPVSSAQICLRSRWRSLIGATSMRSPSRI